MKILGIETSCDETAICILESNDGSNFKILGNALASQAAMHAEYGGVFPMMAKCEHAKNLTPLLEEALRQSHLSIPSGHNSVIPQEEIAEVEKILEREPELFAYLSLFLAQHRIPEIDAIAVTVGPGLEPCLWVGVNFARSLALVWKKPVVAVNHMEGHILASLGKLEHPHIKLSPVEYPALALLISGGHTELILMREFPGRAGAQYEYLGRTRDDAVGEAFDKVARMMDLPYPGGPEISKLAEAARAENVKATYELPRPMLREDNYDFSFSGLKTAASKVIEKWQGDTLPQDGKKALAREFEDCVTDVLVSKTRQAVEEYGAQTVLVGGGVSANKHLRRQFELEFSDAKVLLSAPALATDNAIMIALAGYFQAVRNEFMAPETLTAMGNLKLD